MRFVTYSKADHAAAGLLFNNQVLDLAEAAARCGETADFSSVLDLIRGGAAALEAVGRIAARRAELGTALHDLCDIRLLPPIPVPPRNVFCVGRNYVDHVTEGYQAMQSDVKLPSAPQFFSKATHTVNAPQGDVRLDSKVTRRLDYEAELAVVIGRGGRDISADDAFEHVFGYCVANDVTARDLQRRHDQWFKGKSLDTFLPLGPSIVTKDEIADVKELEVTLTVNGELRQRAKVAQMIFDIPSIIASLSAGLTLEPGDIIATGTPSGVGFAMIPPQYLRDGDVMVTAISGLGELRNRVIEVTR